VGVGKAFPGKDAGSPPGERKKTASGAHVGASINMFADVEE